MPLILLDTNVLVCACDPGEPIKRDQAARVLRYALRCDFCATFGHCKEVIGQPFKSIWRNADYDREPPLPYC